jgi:hypothetical protein
MRSKEIARLASHVSPALDGLMTLTPAPLRAQIAAMMERLGHTAHSDPAAPELVATKDGHKFVTICANPPTRHRPARTSYGACMRQ